MKSLKFSLFLFIAVLVFTPLVSADLETDLSSYFYFNETTGALLDVVGSNDMTVVNSPTRGEPGINNEAYNFTPANSYANKLSPSGLPQGNDDRTVNVWVRSNDYSVGNNQYVWVFGTAASAQDFGLLSLGAGSWYVTGNGATDWNTGISAPADAGWHMITIQHESGVVSLWVDGVEQGNASRTYNTGATRFYVSRGAGDQVGWNFQGNIDELAIWNSSLNQTEITELYNSGTGTFYPFPAPASDPYASVEVRDLYDNATLSGLTVYIGTDSNTTDGSGVVTVYNQTGLNYTVDGGANYFNVSGTATENATVTAYVYGARYNLTAINIDNNTINNFTAYTTTQTNSTTAGSLWLYLKPNTTIEINYSAAGYANKSINISVGSKDIGSYEATLQYDVNLTVKANNSLNTTQAISGLCARVSKVGYNTSSCNTTGTDVYFNQLFPQGTYNVTVYSVGVGDGVNADYSSNTTQFILSSQQTETLLVTPLTLQLTFRDEETRDLLTGTNISVSVIDSESNIFDYLTNTSSIIIQNNLTEGEYTVRYSAANYSLREFYFTLSYDDPITNETLYLLRQSVYSPGTVSVRNFDGTNVAGAKVTMSRYYGNDTIPNQVQSGTTDSNGDVIFVAESVTAFYTFVVEYNGSIVYTQSTPNLLTVDATGLWSKTIVLLRTGTDAVSAATGFSYNFTPQTVLFNNTNQTFNFSVYSFNWTITSCNFYLYGETSGLLNSTSGFCGNSGGSASLTYNILTTENLYTEAVVGTLLFNNTYQQYYNVIVQGNGTFTLAVLFSDIKAFSGNGFNDITRFLLAIIIMMAVTFSLSSRSNYINNPEEILFLMFLLSVGFSYIGWLDVSTPNMPIQEVGQYFISILLGIAAIFAGLRKQGVIGG